MKAAKLFLFCCVMTSFCLIGCGETKNEAIKPDEYKAAPSEEMNEEKNMIKG